MSTFSLLVLGAACVGLAAVQAADFEAPDAPFQTTARPFDGETVSANPPCFVYPATADHAAYLVEVSPDPAFPRETTEVLTSRWMLAVSDRAMKPGAYYWRWRPGRLDDGAAVWSAVRSFTVPDDVPIVPLPDIDALIERIGTSHPRVVVTAAALPDWRRRAAARFGDRWRDGVVRRAEQMRDRELLPEPAFLPDRGDPQRLERYQKTFRTTRPFFRDMYRLAEDYLLTGNELSGREAKRRLLHIISWDPRGSTSLGHNDEPATEVVRYCPLVYDWVYPLLTADERRQCLECLTIRMREMMARWARRPFEKHPYESHNMGYYLPDMLGASLALAGDAPVEDMLAYTMTQLWSPFCPPYGGADGGWNEGPGYWGWVGSVFTWVYRLVETATGIRIQERSHLRNQPYYKLYDNPPYFKLSPFGDGQEGPARNPQVMYELAAMYDNPYAKWYADQLGGGRPSGLRGLLFDAEGIEGRPPSDLPQARAFFDVGLACLHSALPDPESNVAVLLRSCPFGSISHAYADQNTFILDAYGEPLIIASGYYQLYGHPHHREWTWQTRASNSVLVNGEGQSTRDWNAKGALTRFHTLTAAHYAVGDAHRAYPGRLQRFDRQIVYLRPVHTGGEPVILIRDAIEATEPSTYQFLLHALQEMKVDAEAQRVSIERGRARCQVDFLAPAGLSFEQTDKFPVDPIRGGPNQWHLTASTGEKQPGTSSLMVLQPWRADEPQNLLNARVEPGQGGLAVVLSGERRTITTLFRTDPDAETVSWGDLVTDADVAGVSLVDGQPRSAVILAGREVRWRDQPLIVAPARGAVSSTMTVYAGHVVDADLPAADQVRVVVLEPFESAAGSPEPRTIAEVAIEPGGGPVALGTPPPALRAVLRIEGQPDVPLLADTGPILLQRRHLVASPQLGTGFYQVVVELAERLGGACPVTVTVGNVAVRRVVGPRGKAAVVLEAAPLTLETDLELTIDSSRGGDVEVLSATATRVYGVNLFPNPSFETVSGDVPVGYTAGTITRNAQCAVASVPGGRSGERCLKVTCTQATGGDFGVNIRWPGVPLGETDRRFRASCWVRTDAESQAGIQVTSRDWRFWKNTPRLADRAEWTESAVEFILPAGEDLTNARLHMTAAQEGAELWIDDVSLVELPLE